MRRLGNATREGRGEDEAGEITEAAATSGRQRAPRVEEKTRVRRKRMKYEKDARARPAEGYIDGTRAVRSRVAAIAERKGELKVISGDMKARGEGRGLSS